VKIQLGLLETKVARRLLLLFVLSALLPIGALAVLSYGRIGRYLEAQADLRLRTAAQHAQRTITDRLEALETQLAVVAAEAETERGQLEPADLDRSARGVSAATWMSDSGTVRSLFGDAGTAPDLDAQARRELLQGRLVMVPPVSDRNTALLVARRTDGGAPDSGVLWAVVDPTYLWGALEGGPGSAIRVLDGQARVLHGDALPDAAFQRRAEAAIAEAADDPFTVDVDGERLRTIRRAIPLPSSFGAAEWTVMVTHPQSAVIAPLRSSTQGLLPIFLTALLAVLLVSDAQIRRTIHPLKRLKEATGRVAQEDFASVVDVRSNDEFEELAESFNAMTRRLGTQFETLTAISEVDRAALSSTDARAIIDPLLTRLHGIVGSEVISVCLIESDDPHRASAYTVSRGQDLEVVRLEVADSDLQLLRTHWEQMITTGTGSRPGFLSVPCLERAKAKRLVSLPFFFEGEPAGAVTYADRSKGAIDLAAMIRARQVTDQIALALSNVRRLRALDRLNWGALTALARTIDANSPWTAGHSERVATVATLLGERMGLSPDRVELLQRSALLHDIGKIGVSVDILNKPGPLLEDEMDEIREHTVIGARILEPIPDYAELIPIVLHHHERVDGRGYPDGLEGEAIPLEARILAAADMLDALISDRPYRRGLPFKTAVEVIRNAAGSQLDETVVAALLTLVDDDEIDPNAGKRRVEPGRSWVDEASVKRVSLA
jgi:putative nucleotidyltransferase with HDIG domain